MKNQVVSLEIARELNEKLKSVGISVENAIYWTRCKGFHRDNNGERVYRKWWHDWRLSDSILKDEAVDVYEYIPTYTLHEMLEMLPYSIPNRHKKNSGCKFGSVNNCIYYGRCSNSQLTIEKIDDLSFDIGYTCQEHCYISIISIKDNSEAYNPATAAAKLMIWLVDNGYVKGRDEC